MRLAPRIATWVLLAASIVGRSVAAMPIDPQQAPAKDPESPIPIFLNAPSDLEAFWKMLSRPDFVVLNGEVYRKLRQGAEVAKSAKTSPSAVIESFDLTGRVVGEWGRLVVEYRVTVPTEALTWVPIHLDGLTLTEARDASGDLPTRIATEGKGWQVELKGQGEHAVKVGVLAPVRSTVDGRRIELAVPPAASTRVDLLVPENVIEASTGLNEPMGLTASSAGPGVKLSARLSPRSRLELNWRERADPVSKLPTLLSAQGEISLEIERGSIRSRSSWILGAIRGTATELILRLDAAEELLDIELDNKPVQVEARREGSRSVVVIPLVEPLRSTASRTLLVNTRRAIPSTGTPRLALQGYSFDQARVQTGVIAIARTGPIFLNPTSGRGLRRIDPRTELPESLRARHDTTLAFEFTEQPFDLELRVEPAPPRLRVGSRTTVTVAPQSARFNTRLDCRVSQGKVFEVKVVLPIGLEFEGAEPADVVESAIVVPIDPEAAAVPGVEAARIVTITLTPQARVLDAFAIFLKGWSTIDPSQAVALPVFQPRADLSEGDRFAIVADRNVSVELVEPTEGSPAFRVDSGSPPTDWTWPSRRPGAESGLLWLRADGGPATIPLHVTVRPRSILHESTLNASIDRRGAEVVEDIGVEVAFGVVSRLDVSLPSEVPARWEVEGIEIAGREPLAPDAAGHRRYRLKFAKDYTDAFRFRVRYRLPFARPPGG